MELRYSWQLPEGQNQEKGTRGVNGAAQALPGQGALSSALLTF